MSLDHLDKGERQAFFDALVSAFPKRSDLAMMVKLQLDQNFEEVAGGETLRDAVFDLLEWAESHGRLSDLLDGARKENPGNQDLQQLDEQLRHAAAAGPVPAAAPPAGQPAETGFHWSGYADVGEVDLWANRLQTACMAVCRIELHEAFATGFLVAPDVVLTCYHNILALARADNYVDPATGDAKPMSPKGVRLRFDYRTADGTTVLPGSACELADQWLVDGDEGPNYALLRLADPAPAPPSGSARPVLELAAEELHPGDRLTLLQHAAAGPLKVSAAVVIGLKPSGDRVRYSTFTLPGSSGAPCLDQDWKVVAMHESRWVDPSSGVDPATAKVGIPMSRILAQASVKTAIGPR